jgi:hypothetical protein
VLACQEGSCEIQVDGSTPILVADADRVSHDGAANIVLEDVEAAAHVDNCGYSARDIAGRGGIADDSLASSALANYDGARLVDRLAVDVDRNNVRAFSRE